MAYQVRNSKNEDGSYTLSYGKGQKKLIAKMGRSATGMWGVAGVGQMHKTMKACKAAWGEWAEEAYEDGGSKGKAETPPPSSPPPPSPAGPPSFTPKAGPPAFKPPAPKALSTHYDADPFDPRFRNADKHYTPLGVLVQIEAWYERHKAEIKQLDRPQAFTPLIDAVRECLSRELPERQETPDVEESKQKPQPAPARSGPPKLTPSGLADATGTAAETLAGIPEEDLPF